MARQPVPVLTYAISAAAPVRVQEMASVFSDGSVWYWSLAAAAEASRNRAGTFASPPDDAQAAAARDLAAALVALPSGAATGQRGDLRVAVTARAGERERTAVLDYGERGASEALSAPATARAHLRDLLARAGQHPLSVVRLSLGTVAGPSGSGGPPTVRFIFESIGSKPVVFLLRRDSMILRARAGGAWQTWWRNAEGQALALVSPDAALIDGIYAPARLRAGATAAAAVPGSALPTERGADLLQGSVEGLLALLQPHASAPRVPHDPVALQSMAHDPRTGSDPSDADRAGRLL